ncbi:MAG: peptidoglycan-binding domain-containing protein [Minisyncoccia bacterium]
MSVLRKTIFSILVCVMFLGAFSLFVKAESDQELINFLETLITIGVIPSEKADLARTILANALSNTRINRDLKKGSTGEDVKLLQKVLNTNSATVVALSGPGSAGNETTTFGPATEAAVIKFQNFYHFSPTGIVDAVTRAKLNALLSVITNTNVPEADRPSVDLKVNGEDDKVQIGYGGTATLMWTSKNVTSCVSGANKAKPTFGTESIMGVVSPSQFVMTCVGPKGVVSDSVTMTILNNNQTINSIDFVVLGTKSSNTSDSPSTPNNPNNPNNPNKPNDPSKPNNPSDPSKPGDPGDPAGPGYSIGSLYVYVNGVKNYSTTTSSSITHHIVSWTSTGYTSCKGNTDPVINNRADVFVSNPITGSTTLDIDPNITGKLTIVMACATGTEAVNTLNKTPLSSLKTSANLILASSTLTILPPPTASKTLSILVNGVKDYSTTTSSTVDTSHVVSWASTGFTDCKVTSDPIINDPAEISAPSTSSTTLTIKPNVTGKLNLIIACATGTTAVNILNQNPAISIKSSANLMIANASLTLTTPPIKGPTDVSKIIGYGPVNNWEKISATSLASQLAMAGLTTTQVELNIDPYDSKRTATILLPKLKAFITAMRAQKITTFVNLVNGKLHDETGNDYICRSLFTDQLFTDTVNYITQNIGTDLVILQPVSEWVSECHDKRDRFINIFKGLWKGLKSYYVGSHSAPPSSDWFKEYHPSSFTDYGNSGELVSTDSGAVLNAIGQGGDGLAFADTKKLQAYACHVLLGGTRGFIYYGYGHTAIDSGAITALGQLLREKPTSCAAYDAALLECQGQEISVDFAGIVEAMGQCNGRWQLVIKPYTNSSGVTEPVVTDVPTRINPNGCQEPGGNSAGMTWGAGDKTRKLVVFTKGGSPQAAVGDCVLGTSNGNTDAICDETDPALICDGISDGKVRSAVEGSDVFVAGGVIQDMGASACSGATSPAEDGSTADEGGGGSVFGMQTVQWTSAGIAAGCTAGPVGCSTGHVVGSAIGLGSDLGWW